MDAYRGRFCLPIGMLPFDLLGKLERRTRVIISKNLSFSRRDTVFGDAKRTMALLDRLTFRCRILEAGNDSFRFKASAAAATRKQNEESSPLTRNRHEIHNQRWVPSRWKTRITSQWKLTGIVLGDQMAEDRITEISELGTLSNRIAKVSDVYADRFSINRDGIWFLGKITEELGELHSSYFKMTGRGRSKEMTEVELREQLENEVADLFAHVLLFARHLDIDIEDAVQRKWLVHENG